MYNKINRHAQAWWTLWLFNRWLAFRMSIVGVHVQLNVSILPQCHRDRSVILQRKAESETRK
jgi:hypothetical protein